MMMPMVGAVACVMAVVMTSVPRPSLACFPIEDVFASSRHWLQTTSVKSRRLFEVGEEAEDIIVIETEGPGQHGQKMTLRCMMEYGENRYLVRIEDEHENSRYLCYQFTQLTQHVIRQGRTEDNVNRKRVDCIDDHYTEDEEVLVAYDDIQPHLCPLAGGYQLVARQGMAVDGHCLDSVRKYNPSIQFHCDWRGSGNVVVDFGRDCVPAAVSPSMGGHHMTHLRCVSEWEEDGFNSVLLQMRDHPQSFWCLHFKVVNTGNAGSDTGGSEQFVDIFLTVDGRCSSQSFGDDDVPRNTSMFGYLFGYRQDSDMKCREKVYLEMCKLNKDKCLESIDCPGNCGRCKKTVASQNCSFPADSIGNWKVVNSERQLEITIEKTRIKSSNSADFLCVGPAEPGLPEFTYPVIQASADSTCMPYYACANIFSPTPGILTFQLRPSFRSQETGERLSCKHSHDILGSATPPEPEGVITLINQNKLKKTACNHHLRSTYPTAVPGCKVAVHECTGTCQTLNVTFDIPSCGNETERDIENRHICYATLNFEDGVHGILAQTYTSGKYLCWLFGSTRLFVATPEDCNQESVTQIFSDMTAHVKYDPLSAISLPLGNNSADKCAIHTSVISLYVLVVVYVLQTMFEQNVDR